MFIRLEPQRGCFGGRRQYEGICESGKDIEAVERDGYAEYDGAHIEMAAGSLIYSIEDDAVYCNVDGVTWAQIGGEGET